MATFDVGGFFQQIIDRFRSLGKKTPPAVTLPPNTSYLGTLPRLPDAVIGAGAGDSASRQATVAADNALIPIIYGRQRVGGRIFAVAVSGTSLVIGAVWCIGPVDAVESITINDEAVPGTVTVTTYDGSTATVDPTLVAAISGYADTMSLTYAGTTVRLCYSVFTIPAGAVQGFPRVAAIIRGKDDIYDPRTTTTGYSRNPALCLADWLVSPVYGQGLAVDWSSVGTAADACDGTLSDASKRRELDLVIDSELPVAQWADILRTYAGCWIVHDGASVRLVPDRPASPTRALDMSDILVGSFTLRRLSTRESPTVIRVRYTDTTTTPWRDDEVQAKLTGVDAGTVPRREETVSLPGITRRAQAYREAVERLNAVTLTALQATWTTFDDGIQDLTGDVVTLTHGTGLSSEPMRITDVQLTGPGRWQVMTSNYDAAVYSDAVTPPTGGDFTHLPDPGAVPTVTGLTAASGSAYLLALSDGTILSRMAISWTAVSFAWFVRYEVQAKRQTDTIWQSVGMVGEASAMLSPVKDGVTYDLRVAVVNTLNQRGPWATATHVAVGKTEPPPDCDAFSVSVYGDGTRLFSWTLSAAPIDLAGYKLRYVSGSSGTWASMSAMHTGVLTASPFESNALAAGAWTFAIKAVDTSGNESTNAKYITATLPDPRLAGVLDLISVLALGWPGTKTNCWVDSSTGWLMATDTKTWASLATDGKTWATWNDWARDANDLVYTHSSIDIGTITTFTPLVTATVVEGSALIQERTSNDGSTWSSYATAASAPVTARYYQVKVTVSGAAGTQIGLQNLQIILSADPLEEVIEDLSTSTLTGSYDLGVGSVRLPITEDFAQIRSVFVTLQNVGAGWSWELIDKDTTVGPHIKIYNSSNTLADASIDALIRGL